MNTTIDSIKKYFDNNSYKCEPVEEVNDDKYLLFINDSNKEFIKILRFKDPINSNNEFIIIIDYVLNENYGGVESIKKIRSLWPPIDEGKSDSYWIPIIFISNDEVWKFQDAYRRTDLNKNFLNVTEGIICIKFPFEIVELKKTIEIIRNKKDLFKTKKESIEAIGVIYGYDLHPGHK